MSRSTEEGRAGSNVREEPPSFTIKLWEGFLKHVVLLQEGDPFVQTLRKFISTLGILVVPYAIFYAVMWIWFWSIRDPNGTDGGISLLLQAFNLASASIIIIIHYVVLRFRKTVSDTHELCLHWYLVFMWAFTTVAVPEYDIRSLAYTIAIVCALATGHKHRVHFWLQLFCFFILAWISNYNDTYWHSSDCGPQAGITFITLPDPRRGPMYEQLINKGTGTIIMFLLMFVVRAQTDYNTAVLAKSVKSNTLTENIMEKLKKYDTDGAQQLLAVECGADNEVAVSSLYAAAHVRAAKKRTVSKDLDLRLVNTLQDIVDNLEKFKPFLPNYIFLSLNPESTSDDEDDEIEEGDLESDRTGNSSKKGSKSGAQTGRQNSNIHKKASSGVVGLDADDEEGSILLDSDDEGDVPLAYSMSSSASQPGSPDQRNGNNNSSSDMYGSGDLGKVISLSANPTRQESKYLAKAMAEVGNESSGAIPMLGSPTRGGQSAVSFRRNLGSKKKNGGGRHGSAGSQSSMQSPRNHHMPSKLQAGFGGLQNGALNEAVLSKITFCCLELRANNSAPHPSSKILQSYQQGATTGSSSLSLLSAPALESMGSMSMSQSASSTFGNMFNPMHLEESLTPEATAEILGQFLDILYETAKITKASVHSMLGDTVQLTWNATHRVAQAEVKACQFLCRLKERVEKKMKTSIPVYGAVVSGRAMVFNVTSATTKQKSLLIDMPWLEALNGAFALAKKYGTLLADEVTKRAAGLHIDFRGVEKVYFLSTNNEHKSSVDNAEDPILVSRSSLPVYAPAFRFMCEELLKATASGTNLIGVGSKYVGGTNAAAAPTSAASMSGFGQSVRSEAPGAAEAPPSGDNARRPTAEGAAIGAVPSLHGFEAGDVFGGLLALNNSSKFEKEPADSGGGDSNTTPRARFQSQTINSNNGVSSPITYADEVPPGLVASNSLKQGVASPNASKKYLPNGGTLRDKSKSHPRSFRKAPPLTGPTNIPGRMLFEILKESTTKDEEEEWMYQLEMNESKEGKNLLFSKALEAATDGDWQEANMNIEKALSLGAAQSAATTYGGGSVATKPTNSQDSGAGGSAAGASIMNGSNSVGLKSNSAAAGGGPLSIGGMSGAGFLTTKGDSTTAGGTSTRSPASSQQQEALSLLQLRLIHYVRKQYSATANAHRQQQQQQQAGGEAKETPQQKE